MAGAGWSVDETRALISVWGQANVQSQLDGVMRNRVIFERIARDMEELGYERTWQQCRTKIKNLTQKYRKVRASPRSTPCFSNLDWLATQSHVRSRQAREV